MKDEELMFYLWEIDEQCRYATMAWKAMQTNDSDVQWYSIQAFLVAIANVSKILWPVKATERGERALVTSWRILPRGNFRRTKGFLGAYSSLRLSCPRLVA